MASVSGFLHHFLRKDYGTFQLFSGNSGQQTAGLLARTIAYLSDVLRVQGMWVVLPLSMGGICCLLTPLLSRRGGGRKSTSQAQSTRRRSAVVQAKAGGGKGKGVGNRKGSSVESTAIGTDVETNAGPQAATEYPDSAINLAEGQAYIPPVVIATLCFYFLVFHSLSNLPLDNPLLYGVHQRFWMQPSVILFAMGGIGFNTALKKTSEVAAKHYPPAAASVPPMFLVLSVLLCAGQAHKWYAHSDQSDAYYFRDYAKALVDPLPPSSILIINYDMQW